MAGRRVIGKLTAKEVEKLSRVPGKYEDGGGLRLEVKPSGAASWITRVSVNGTRVAHGLGPYPQVSLAEARQKTEEARRAAREGRSTIAEQRAAQRVAARPLVTLREAFDQYWTVKERQLSNGKHIAQWRVTMETYVFPSLGDRDVAAITHADVLDVITPIWFRIPETGSRVLQRLRAVFKSATIRGHRQLANPCEGIAEELVSIGTQP